MNRKFKRALSSILTFIMALSCLTVMNVSSVLADDTTTTYDLTASPFGSSADYSGTITSGDLTVSGNSYSSGHGVVFNSNDYFTLVVTENTTITFTTCKYNNSSSITVTDVDGNTVTVTDEDGNTVSSFTTTGTDKDGTCVCGGTISCTYEGEATTLKFTSTGSNYIDKITATPVSSESGDDSGDDDDDDSGTTSTTTSLLLDFRTSGFVPATVANYYFVKGDDDAYTASTDSSSDYDVSVTNVYYHGTTYGLAQSGSFPVITFKDVTAPVKITLGATDYGGYFEPSATVSGNFLDADGIIVTSVNGYNATSKTAENVYYFNGSGTTTITLTGTSGSGSTSTMYISTLAVETVSEDDVPESASANSSVQINATNTSTGDVLVLTDSGSNEYSVTIKNGVADFSGNNILIGDATVSAEGYTLSPSTITITSYTNEYNVTATATATEEIAEDSDTSVIYAGYVAKDGYTVYNTVQAAVSAAEEGETIQLAPKTFKERVVVETANVTITGTSADETVITFNDSEANNDTYFHGATVAVLAEGFTASNLTIKNTSEKDGTAKDSSNNVKNGTAFSIGYADKITASATLTDCVIWATRDTIFTGKASSTSNTTYDSCTIYGFQDVICGAGDVTLNDCTWDVNSANNARFFAPQKGSTSIANNLTVINTVTGYTKSTFARAWGQSSDNGEFDCTVIINGYTDSANNIYSNGATISTDNTSIYGFETTFVGTFTGDITEMMWLVRKTEDKGNYNTTYGALNKTTANEVQSSNYDSDETAYRVVGIMDSDFINEGNISKIGFAVYDGTTFEGNVSSDTVYTLNGDDTAYYTVVFMENETGLNSVTVMPYVEYDGYNVEGNASQTITFSNESE